MNTNSPEWNDEHEDDEATLPASGDTVDEIRAEAARLHAENEAFDPSEDPTTVMAKGEPASVDPDLAEEPTIISFDPAHDVTVIESFDADGDLTPGAFDPSDDPTTVMAPAPTTATVADVEPEVWTPDDASEWQVVAAPAGAAGSLIEGKAPPAVATSYWERDELAGAAASSAERSGKAPVPKWFIATSLLAVLMAVGLVLLVLWALSGSTP